MARQDIWKDKKEVGRLIRQLRERGGINSQRELAEAIELGGGAEQVSKWERGISRPSAENFYALAALFRVDVAIFQNLEQPVVRPAAVPRFHPSAIAAAVKIRAEDSVNVARALHMTELLARLCTMGHLAVLSAVAASRQIADEDGYSAAERDYVERWAIAVEEHSTNEIVNANRGSSGDTPG